MPKITTLQALVSPRCHITNYKMAQSALKVLIEALNSNHICQKLLKHHQQIFKPRILVPFFFLITLVIEIDDYNSRKQAKQD